VVIDGSNLRELEMSDRKYTWANARENPTYKKLDIILMSTEREHKVPLSTVGTITRDILDHTPPPLLINTGQNHPYSNHTLFKFKLGWLLRDGFANMVKNIWSAEIGSGTAMERWKAKIRRLRQQLRGWAKNVSGAYKKEKKELLDKLDSLDKKAESTLITLYEINLKCCLNKRLRRK
jgi:hypothetical protein